MKNEFFVQETNGNTTELVGPVSEFLSLRTKRPERDPENSYPLSGHVTN